jgi:GAF domain-containing protein
MQKILSFPGIFNGLSICQLDILLDCAIQLTRADFGNVQLFDPAIGGLKIVTQRGFEKRFLDFFECVKDEGSACGAAMKNYQHVIVPDVTTSPIFVRPGKCDPLEVLLSARVRAVYSIPLFNSFGSLIGMLSGHYRTPTNPNPEQLEHLELVARRLVRIAETARRGQIRDANMRTGPVQKVIPFARRSARVGRA